MPDHDPLCPMREPDPGDTVRQSSCECYLIAKVRVDERERIAQALDVAAFRFAEDSRLTAVSDAYFDAARIARNGGRDA